MVSGLSIPMEMNAATDQAVKWYLSLAYLKNGNKSKAKGMLQLLLKEPSGEFYIKAGELLKELDL
jgi:Tfp pilus assembly protein FimV